jgi:hypothetical protein
MVNMVIYSELNRIIQQTAVLTAFPYVTRRGILLVSQNFAILIEFVFTVAERVVCVCIYIYTYIHTHIYIYSKPDTFTSSS